jgi:hypothetical protein
LNHQGHQGTKKKKIMTLDDLAAWEERLSKTVNSCTGLMEDQFKELEKLGVFSEYVQIHQEYVSRIGTDASGIEALKRALFIQWYADSEPGCFTGILRIDPFARKRVCVLLDQIISQDGVDDEFQWMLCHYFAISDWSFPVEYNTPNLHRFLKTNTSEKLPERFMDKNRGIMSHYWTSILNREPGTWKGFNTTPPKSK